MREGSTTKIPTLSHSEAASVPAWTRGKIYYLLANPIYIGKVKHHDQAFDGEHEAIIDADQFARAQALLRTQSPRNRNGESNHAEIHRLTGILFDETGDRLSPAYASNHGKRYRYYVSNRLRNGRGSSIGGWRIPAEELDTTVEEQLRHILADETRVAEWVGQYASSKRIGAALETGRQFVGQPSSAWTRTTIQTIVRRITLAPESIRFEVDPCAVVGTLLADHHLPAEAKSDGAVSKGTDRDRPTETIDVAIAIKRRGSEVRIVIGNGAPQDRAPDPKLIDLIARAHLYLRKLTDGTSQSIAAVADQYRIHRADISRILPLAFLAPSIVDAILGGRQPATLSAQKLARAIDLPLAWHQQDFALGN